MLNAKCQMPNGRGKIGHWSLVIGHFSSAYTLLELLIVISIMTIIFSVGFASYRGYQQRQQMKSANAQIISDLRLTQQYATASRKPDTTPDNPCETSTLLSYDFIRVSGTSYRIEAHCSGGNYTVKDIPETSLPAGITMSSIPGSAVDPTDTIPFHVLGRGIDRSANTTLTLTQAGTGITSQVTVSLSGEIK